LALHRPFFSVLGSAPDPYIKMSVHICKMGHLKLFIGITGPYEEVLPGRLVSVTQLVVIDEAHTYINKKTKN
jgi:hypothetical protein